MKRDPFENVLEAFAVELGHDVGTVVDADELYHQALEEGVITEAALEASFDRLLEMPLLEVDAERLALDPIGALAAACAAAGAVMMIWGRPVTEAELRLDAAGEDDHRRVYDMVTVPGFIVVPRDPRDPHLDIEIEMVTTDPELLAAIRENGPAVEWLEVEMPILNAGTLTVTMEPIAHVGEPERVLNLLEAVSDYDQTAEEAEKELVADGVDVPAFLDRVHQAVEEVKPPPRWANMDGEIHVVGECCQTWPGRVCGKCGARVHEMPVYGGIAELCETCDAEHWTTGKPPAPCGDFV